MIDKKLKWYGIIMGLVICLTVVAILGVSLGATEISFSEVSKILINEIPVLSELIELEDNEINQMIVFQLRLPRVLLAGLVGVALATSGTAFQALLKNPMADPYIIGISSGASLGAALGMVFNLDVNILRFNTIPLLAFIGALGTTFIVYNLAKSGRKVAVATLLLAGIAVGSFLSAVVSLLMVFNDDSIQRIIFWTMGSLADSSWQRVGMIWIYILIGYVIIHLLAKDLNIMLLGEESAQSLGIEVEKIKKVLLLAGALLAGAAVAGSGVIGFVGLIIPHIVRLVVGPDHRILIPSSALVGAAFLILTDLLARTLIAPTEIPVGIITSLFGAPFFIYLLHKKKRTGF
ncbi:iron chelate uptake ABC transporter family permease subunit [Natroniella acetigena]|uniref:FecCD family ABC transporter permease n=1 Tax=Natroniella acetigena TaxID=52004 RepID=UPI00200A72E5|nr:iron chelate uptake ABC transporter family permease subunit [Natroniella acetigena]MCK8826554.1 iron chelate uptake ABC transporter family permease subunit [Natroniella acetigena]